MKTLKLGMGLMLTMGLALAAPAWSDECPCHVEEMDAYAQSIATKMKLHLPLDPMVDFPSIGLTNMNAQEKEALRASITEHLSDCLGKHAGWKIGVTAATPATPALGYTAPFYGELLEEMIIVGNQVQIDLTSPLLPFIETDLLFKIKSSDIMNATTPQEVLQHVSGVYGAIEFASGYTDTVPKVLGPASGGQGILDVLNGAANGFVRSTKLIKIPGKRSLAQWETVLNGGLNAEDFLIRTSGNLNSTSPGVAHLDDMLKLINILKDLGLTMQAGDLVSPGTAVAVNLMNGTESMYTAKYYNLDPNGPLEMNIIFNAQGACFQGDAHHAKGCDDNDEQ